MNLKSSLLLLLSFSTIIPSTANANPIPKPLIPSVAIAGRGILNGSFESPIVTTYNKATGNSYSGNPVVNMSGGNIPEGYGSPDPIVWQTTEPGSGGAPGQFNLKDRIEVWRGTTPGGIGGQESTSGAGEQYAEINGNNAASLYQDICVLPGETVAWSLLHAARYVGQKNVMAVSITSPGAWGSSKIPPNTKLYESKKLSTKFSDGWQEKAGSWISTISSIKPLRFAFEAVDGSYKEPSLGNFVDDIKLNLSPIVDFLPTGVGNVNLSKTKEGNPTPGNYYYLSLRINGTMSSAGSVTIDLNGLSSARKFTIGKILKGDSIVSGLEATKKDNNQITLDIPTGTYDPNLPSDYIHIPIDFSDTTKTKNDNLVFTLTNSTGGGTTSGFALSDLAIGSSSCSPVTRNTVKVILLDDDYIPKV